MKKEIIIIILAFTGSAFGERHERSTVLTDESKRVLDHFDFSNFDKQEALNYLDRQRYDNQIRGKRSQSKRSGSPQIEKMCHETLDVSTGFQKNLLDKKQGVLNKLNSQGDLSDCIINHEKEAQVMANEQEIVRNKRGHHHHHHHHYKKKKHRNKYMKKVYDYNDYSDGTHDRKERIRRKKKKKKRYYWDRWSEWSPCSVTCGRGRKIRWRKCIASDCELAEREMGEKTCQLPACNILTKILGI